MYFITGMQVKVSLRGYFGENGKDGRANLLINKNYQQRFAHLLTEPPKKKGSSAALCKG